MRIKTIPPATPIILLAAGSENRRDAPRKEMATNSESLKKIPKAKRNAGRKPLSKLVCISVKKAGPNIRLKVKPATNPSIMVCQTEYKPNFS